MRVCGRYTPRIFLPYVSYLNPEALVAAQPGYCRQVSIEMKPDGVEEMQHGAEERWGSIV